MIPVVDRDKCTGCGSCVSMCPKQIIELEDGKAKIDEPNKCDQLWGCISICPSGAISKKDD